MSEGTAMNALLNLLVVLIVGAAAVYVARYGARVLGLSGWFSRRNAGASGPADSGGCGGGCDGCAQRDAHKRV